MSSTKGKSMAEIKIRANLERRRGVGKSGGGGKGEGKKRKKLGSKWGKEEITSYWSRIKSLADIPAKTSFIQTKNISAAAPPHPPSSFKLSRKSASAAILFLVYAEVTL